jgi:hypothetical protein
MYHNHITQDIEKGKKNLGDADTALRAQRSQLDDLLLTYVRRAASWRACDRRACVIGVCARGRCDSELRTVATTRVDATSQVREHGRVSLRV